MLDRHERGIQFGVGDAACAGVAYGLCAAVRPNALLLALPLGRAARFAPRAWLPAMLVFGLAAGAVIMPIALRNYVVAGEPVLLTAHGGLNVYLGNGLPCWSRASAAARTGPCSSRSTSSPGAVWSCAFFTPACRRARFARRSIGIGGSDAEVESFRGDPALGSDAASTRSRSPS